MPWDLRPRLPNVSSMSSIPVAGNMLSYAMKNTSARTTRQHSRSSSPPPQYDNRSTAGTDAIMAPEELERALVFQRRKTEASERLRYVAQGSVMLRASQEAQTDATSIQQLQFSRELYMTSIDYLLRGVPTDLDEAEQESLRRTIGTLYNRVGIQVAQAPIDDRESRQVTQQIIVTFCRGTAIIIKKSIPKIKQGIEQAIEFENQYHVLEKSGIALSNSIMTMADKASRVNWALPNFSILTSIGQTVTLGLTAGIIEGYRVLAEEDL